MMDFNEQLSRLMQALAAATVSRRTFLKGLTALSVKGATNLALASPLKIARFAALLQPVIDVPPNFRLAVVRPDDLLALDFEFINLTLDTTQGQPPRLVRTQPDKPAFMVVHFPAQHIRETGFLEVILEDKSHKVLNLQDPPISAVMANRSRLVFQVPVSTQSIPLTLSDLLAWTRLIPVLPKNALSAVQGDARSPAKEPEALETAIELPYRLVLSPDASGVWTHADKAVTHDRRTELWHTRLILQGSDGPEPTLPVVRAVWARDLDSKLADTSSTLPIANTRTQIASLSSDFSLLRDHDPSKPYNPPPLEVHRLILSALGGWTDMTGNWNLPKPPGFDLTDWHQIISMGRDQYVRVVQTFHLACFGHRGALIDIAERKLERSPNGQLLVNYLIKETFFAVLEPLRDYRAVASFFDKRGRELPFQSVRITTLLTPTLQSTPASGDFPTLVDGSHFKFHFIAENFGQTVDFSMPLMLVGEDANGSDYNTKNVSDRQADLRNQIVIFAASVNHGDTHLKTASISFKVEAGPLQAGLLPPFLPTMELATVSIPAVDHLLGSSGTPDAMPMRFHPTYLNAPPQQEFDHAVNPGQVFMQLMGQNGAPLQQGLPIRIPADKAGGLVTPSMAVNGLSRSLGPVSGVDNIAKGGFDPQDAFGALADAKLLGAISLKALIQNITAPSVGTPLLDLDAQVPKLIQTRTDQSVITSYTWNPKVMRINDPSKVPGDDSFDDPKLPVVTTKDTKLRIEVSSITPLDGNTPPTPPSFIVDGTLTNFALNLIDVVLVNFTSIQFHAENGHKMSLTTGQVHVSFMKELSFVDTLAELLPPQGFGTGASIEVTPDGITTGYTIGLPTAGVGAFSLENIALSAKLLLPLPTLPVIGSLGKPASLRLAFSERFHPFLVTLSLIGGGGFLAVVLNTGGIEQIEGSLEIGGNITVNLFIVEANIHAMIGVYFGLRTGADSKPVFDFSAFIRIGGSVDLLGIISVSIELYVGLGFQTLNEPSFVGRVYGRASLTIGVHVLFVEKSFTLSLEREFKIPARVSPPLGGGVSFPILSDPSFDDMVSLDDWLAYCQAFI